MGPLKCVWNYFRVCVCVCALLHIPQLFGQVVNDIHCIAVLLAESEPAILVLPSRPLGVSSVPRS